MDVERLVVRLIADATRYNAIMDRVSARLTEFATYASLVLGKTAIQLAADYEKAGIAFEVMTKDAAIGKKILDDVANLAKESPFTSAELIKSAKQVKAFGFDTKDIIPILSRLGDVASATGTDMDRIILAFGQVRTTGRLMGQELRQFTNAGVPILEYLAQAMGTTTAAVPNLVRQGRVGFADVAAAFNLMTNEGGIFFKMMERVNKETLSGRWQNFKETVQIAARNLGLAASEGLGLKDALTRMSASGTIDMQRAKKFFEDFRKGLQGVGFVAGKLWENLKKLWAAIKDLVKQAEEWGKRNKEVVRTILEIVGALAAAYLIVKTITTAWALIVGIMVAVKAAFLLLLTPIMTAVNAVAALILVLNELGAFKGMGAIFSEGFGLIWETFKTTWTGITDAIAGGDLQLAWDTAIAGIKVAWETLLATMEAAWVRFQANMKEVWEVDFFEGMVAGATRLARTVQFNWKIAGMGWGFKEIEAERKKMREQEFLEEEALLKRKDDARKRINDEAEREIRKIMDAVKETEASGHLKYITGLAEAARRFGKEMKDAVRLADWATVKRDGFWQFDPNELLTDPKAAELMNKLPKFSGQFALFGNPAAWMMDASGAVLGDSMRKEFVAIHREIKQLIDSIVARRAGDPNAPTEAQITEAIAKVKERKRVFDELVAAITRVGDATKKMVANITEPLTHSAEAIKAAQDIGKVFQRGVGPMGEFIVQTQLLREATMGPLNKLGLENARPGLGGLVGMAGMAAIERDPRLVDEDVERFWRFRNFESLRSKIKMDRAEGAGPAMLQGSREAQETINRSNAQVLSVEQQVLQTLRDANYIHDANMKHQSEVVRILKRVEPNFVPPPQQGKVGN